MSLDNPKQIVEQAYDNIADWYLRWVQDTQAHSPRERYAEAVLANARDLLTAENSKESLAQATPADLRPRILDLGCGPGVPITRLLLDRGAHVVANDISSTQLSMARARCPEAEFLPGDMTLLSFPPGSFDGAVSFYTIFHLPRGEQKVFLAQVYAWLKPGAVLAMNLATEDAEEIHGEMLGYGMFWSSFGKEESRRMVEEVGFEVLEAKVRGAEEGDGGLEESDPDYGAEFLWLLVRKKGV